MNLPPAADATTDPSICTINLTIHIMNYMPIRRREGLRGEESGIPCPAARAAAADLS
jgi:hypothetical protein